MPPRKKASPKDSTANLGFEAKLWLTADKLRNNMDTAVPSGATTVPQAKAYKHGVLDLIFFTNISDTFEKHRANPPFNDSDWFHKEDDMRWQYGIEGESF